MSVCKNVCGCVSLCMSVSCALFYSVDIYYMTAVVSSYPVSTQAAPMHIKLNCKHVCEQLSEPGVGVTVNIKLNQLTAVAVTY